MTTEYTEAPEVAEIAERLIERHHTHLLGLDIEYVFRSGTPARGSKAVLGRARKVQGLAAYLSRTSEEPFFLIEITEHTWGDLTQAQKEALVDHELCHFGVTEEGNLHIIPHDLDEFTIIVERHGLWNPDVRRMASAVTSSEGDKNEQDLV